MNVTLVIFLACWGKILCFQKDGTKRSLEGHIVGGVEVTIGMYPFVATLLTKSQAYCGGSIISDRVILTAAHCLEPKAFEIEVVLGSLEGHIVGGVEVTIGMYPFVATLLTKSQAYCGGSIISDRVILTAAHCLEPKAFEIEVVLGATRWRNGVKYQVCQILPYPKRQDYIGDLGLVLLAKKIQFGRTVRKIPIVTTSKWRNKRYRFEVAGFGMHSDLGMGGGTSPVLKATRMRYVPRHLCNETISDFSPMYVPNSMFCMVGENWSSDCFGDSGSAVLWKARWLVGTVTVGRQVACGAETVPSMYTDALYYRKWIINSARELEKQQQCVKDE